MDTILNHFQKLDCPEFYNICVKYFLVPIDNSNRSSKTTQSDYNPAEFLVNDILQIISSNRHEINLSASCSSQIDQLKSILIKDMIKSDDFFTIFNQIYNIDDYPIFKTAILAQTAINNQLTIESNKNRKQQQAQIIPISSRKSQSSILSSNSLTKYLNGKKIHIFIYKAFIALTLLLYNYQDNILDDEEIKSLPKSNFAAFFYLLKYFDVFITNDDIQQYNANNSISDSTSKKISTNLSNDKIDLNDFFEIFKTFLSFFSENSITFITFKDKNSPYFNFFMSVLTTIIQMMPKFSLANHVDFLLAPISFYFSYFSSKHIVFQQYDMLFQVYFEMINQLKSLLNENSPERFQTKVMFLLSSVINNFDIGNKNMPVEQALKVCFESLSLFSKLTIIKTDPQSTLIFTTSLLGFINVISSKYETETDYENSQSTRTIELFEKNDINEDKLQYMNPHDYFGSHLLMHFYTLQESHPNPMVQDLVKLLKNFFNQSNFETSFIFQALTDSFLVLNPQSYNILLSSFSGKFIKICDPIVDFISHLLQMDIYKMEPTKWNLSQIQLNYSILYFLFGVFSKNKGVLPIFSAISRLNFSILMYLLPMLRSLLMIDEEINFSRNFCQSNMIDMIRFHLTPTIMSNEKMHHIMDDIVGFLQVISVSNPRVAFSELSFVQLLKDFLKENKYVDILLPCFKTGILTTDEKCIINILQQIALVVIQATEDESYIPVANKSIFILSEVMNSLTKKSLKDYEDNHIFELISKFPNASKNRESLVISLKFFLNVCLKFNSYIQMFSDILIYQHLKDAFVDIKIDSEIFTLLLSMSMNSVTDLESIEKCTIQNRSALKLLFSVIKDSDNEIELLKGFQKLCASNNSNIYECFQSGLVFYLLERVDVPHLQSDVFSLFQLICTKVCSPMILNKIHSTMISSKCRLKFLDTLLKMMRDDSSLQVSSFFAFSGARTGIFGPSIDISYLSSEWSFSTAINIENVPSVILNLSEGSSNLTFSINPDYKVEFVRTEKKNIFKGEFKKLIEKKKWTFLTFVVTFSDISMYVNFEYKETFPLSEGFTYNGPAMIKIAEGLTGEIGRTYFFSTIDINTIKEEVLKNDIIKKYAICSYDPRGAYMGEIIDATSDNRCHLMGTAVPFSSSFRDIIQSEGIYQLFMTYFSIVDSEEFFILCIQVLNELINISDENAKYFEKIGGFRLLIGLFSIIDKKLFTIKVSDQILQLFISLKNEYLHKQMFISYWMNITFISTLDSEFQIHFYEEEFYNAFINYRSKITLDFAEALLYEIAKAYDNSNVSNKSIRELQFGLFARIINDVPSSIYRNLFQFLIMLFNKNTEIELQKQILNIFVNNTNPSTSQNQFELINYAFPLFLSPDNEVRLLSLKFISNIISNSLWQQTGKEIIYNALMFIKDDKAELFNECFKIMFINKQNNNDIDIEKLNLFDDSIQINSIIDLLCSSNSSCEYFELAPILLMLSIFHTKQEESNEENRNKIYNLMHHAFPKLGSFYNNLASPLCLLIYSLNFSDNLDRFVEPFVTASFSNIRLINYILLLFDSFSKFSKTDVFKWKLHFCTKVVQRSIRDSLYMKEVATTASQFMFHRYKPTEDENDAKEDEIKEVIYDDVSNKKFTEQDSIEFIDYLANSTTSSTLDQAYIFVPCLVEDEPFLELLFDLLYLLMNEENNQNVEIPLSSTMKITASKLRKIIASTILKNNPNNEAIRCQILEVNLPLGNNNSSNLSLQQNSSPSSAFSKKPLSLFKFKFKHKNHTKNENNENAATTSEESNDALNIEDVVNNDSYESITATEENFITSYIKESETHIQNLINDLNYDWQYLLDFKPIFFSFRTEILANIFKTYTKYLESLQKNNNNNSYLMFYLFDILKAYKHFIKTVRRRTFMYQKHNQKLAKTYLNESNERLDDSSKKHWKASSKFDSYGRKLYFAVNRNFNNHIDASKLRDSLTDETNEEEDSQNTNKSKKEQITSLKRILEINRSLTKYYKKEQDLSFEVMMVTVIGKYQGKLIVTNKMLLFEGTLKYESFEDHTEEKQNDKQKFVSIPLKQILFIFNRWTMHIDNSCEVFSLVRKSYFFIFPDTQTRTKFYNKIDEIIGKPYKPFKYSYFFTECCHICNGVCQNNVSNNDLVMKTNLSKDWQQRKISNFQYIFFLNIVSGRSFNDLSQYPVYPWILKDYESEKIDLNDEKIYRDLSIPVTAMNEERLKDCLVRCDDMDDPIEKCQFRSFYSSPALIIGYMIRLEPFTSLHIELQSGRFDYADRLFYSINKTWNQVTSSNNDYRELIPEFYTFPQIFKNENKFDLGKIQSRDYFINDVELPNWASNVYEFVEIHQRALESEYVRLHLNEWIDLIFGCYQRSYEKRTMYHIYSYHECMKIAEIVDDPGNQQLAQYHSANFGSSPDKLFSSHSPKSILSMPKQVANFSQPSSPFNVTITTTPTTPMVSTPTIPLSTSVSSGVVVGGGSLLTPNNSQNNLLFNIETAQSQLSNNQALCNALNNSENVVFCGCGVVLFKNGCVYSVFKNFSLLYKISMQIEPNYKKVLYFSHFYSFVFLQRNGGFASCVTFQKTDQNQVNEVLRTISHKSSTIECLCMLGKNVLISGGSDCCINVWKAPEFTLTASIPIQSGVIVSLAADLLLESIVAIDSQNLVYLLSINPVKHVLTFPLNLPENVNKHSIILLRTGLIVVASDSADRKTFSMLFFDLRGLLIKKLEFDGSVAKFFPMYPSSAENFVVVLVARTRRLIVIDLASFDVVKKCNESTFNNFIWPIDDKRAILYLKNASHKEICAFEF